jgi:hypothetical protein
VALSAAPARIDIRLTLNRRALPGDFFYGDACTRPLCDFGEWPEKPECAIKG